MAWKMFVDGAKNSLAAGTWAILESPKGAIFEHYLRLNFLTTKNKLNTKPSLWDFGLLAN